MKEKNDTKRAENVSSSYVLSDFERLNRQLAFTTEIEKMKEVYRRSLLINGSRNENDAEHSWHIAVMALVFSEYASEKVDTGLAVKMLVIHDLVEVYAGDTFAYDKKGYETKRARETESADKLFSILPREQGKEIRNLWEEFERMETPTAKYANCMDRLEPFILNTLTGGYTWKQGYVRKDAITERMKIVEEFMPKVFEWVRANIENGVKAGWIKE